MCGEVHNDTDLNQNNFCFISNTLKSFGQNLRDEQHECKVGEFENKEDLKSIDSQLGPNFKADTNNKNEGFPILVWQEK